MFFSSSSPLRNEADNWFLRELRGRYDMVLQYLSNHPGCTNADIEAAMAQVSSPGEVGQVGGYLKILSERYNMIERRLPVFAAPRARSGRYYVRDNFLRAWLSALKRPVSAIAFRPLHELLNMADVQLADVEGHALESLAGQLYEERSRKDLGDFPLSERIHGYWDRADVEIDLVAINGQEQRIRFGTCKRNPDKLLASVPALQRSAQRFVDAQPRFKDWKAEFVAIAPELGAEHMDALRRQNVLGQSLAELTRNL
jgi:hypothetical protein